MTSMSEQIDSRMLRDAFGAFPNGRCSRSGAGRREAGGSRGFLVHIGLSRSPAIVFLCREKLDHVARAAPSRAPRRHRARRGPWRIVPPAGRPGPGAVHRRRLRDHRQWCGDARRGNRQYDCTVREELEAGDHVIVLLQLHAVVVHSRGQPLIFYRSEFGRLSAPPPKPADSNA